MSGPQIVCCICGDPCGIYSPVCNTCAAWAIPSTTPDPIAADEAEHGVCAMGELPELSPAQLAEGDITSERL